MIMRTPRYNHSNENTKSSKLDSHLLFSHQLTDDAQSALDEMYIRKAMTSFTNNTNEHLVARVHANRNMLAATLVSLCSNWWFRLLMTLMLTKCLNHVWNMYGSAHRILDAFTSAPIALHTFMHLLKTETSSQLHIDRIQANLKNIPYEFVHKLMSSPTPPQFSLLQLHDVRQLWTHTVPQTAKIFMFELLGDIGSFDVTKLVNMSPRIVDLFLQGSKWFGWYDLEMSIHRANIKLTEVNLEIQHFSQQQQMLTQFCQRMVGVWTLLFLSCLAFRVFRTLLRKIARVHLK